MSRQQLWQSGWAGQVLAVAAVVTAAASVSVPTVRGRASAQGEARPKADGRPAARVQYNRDVRPILSDTCFPCHGPDTKQRKAKLRLDTREGAVGSRAGSVAVVPGNPEESELVARLFSEDPDEVMPPPSSHKVLSAAQKETLRRWVAEGAEYQAHWAYIPPKRPPIPPLKDSTLVHDPIDAFVQSVLEAKSVKPSAEADRRTLIRRLSLDLTGLPPTPAEVQAFLVDASPKAYETVVDRVLASPRYGERMAQGWLDVARYADTVGFHGDQNQNAWAYRDYVINAYNANKPFDEFTVEQLAGDLLPDPTPEQRTATCFNRLTMMTREGGAQPKEYLSKYTADRVRTVALAWLGSTMNCCECHDHKFDPFTAKDFYSMGAFFADVKQWGVYADYGYTPNPDLPGWTNDHPWPPEIIVESPALGRRIDEIKAKMGRIVASEAPPAQALNEWRERSLAFLKGHPDGWECPEPAVKAGPAAARNRASAKAAANAVKPPEQSGTSEVKKDGRIVFGGTGATHDEIDLAPTPGWLAAVRIEILPDPARQNRIVRGGDRARVKPAFRLVSRDGKTRSVAIRHAQADRHVPTYVNGFDVLGVQSGWATDPKDVAKPHTAVYVLDRPVPVSDGDRLRVAIPDDLLACVRVSTSPLAPADLQHPSLPTDLSPDVVARACYLRSTAWNSKLYDQIESLDADRLECRDGKTPVMVTERTDKPLTVRVLKRGNWMDETGEVCRPATPGFLPKLTATPTRLDLARWICSPENPLTARVVMNRLWRQLFGNGLSAQVDDLGAQGEPPSHPELLDWLAVEFREGGWDVKRMVKLIVMSHTYRQSSRPRAELHETDPHNRLLAGQNPRRLEAEAVRDNALAIAGLLNTDLGGPPSHPYQPGGYYEGLQFPDREYTPERDERQFRRGVYSHWQRTFLHPMLANFDAPSREDCVAMRTAANSPQQALTLLNDPEFVEAARVWAGRLLAEKAAGDESRIDLAYEQALARPPSSKERSSLLSFLKKAREEYRKRPVDARALLRIGVAPEPGKGTDPVELASWATLCRVVLNLHETITRY